MYSNDLIYLLDLCILSYHLHSQTLIWPMDPYYEQMVKRLGSRRNNFKTIVHQSANKFQNEKDGDGIPLYHGPGGFFGTQNGGWQTNLSLDPIISNYNQINPLLPGFTRPEPGQWILYNTPQAITGRIGTIKFARYAVDSDPLKFPRAVLVDLPSSVPGRGPDWLYCFEGGTGAIGVGSGNTNATSPAWSMMGFILVEDTGNAQYNIHIVFRGSRSGSGTRAVLQGAKGKGNPDWSTDLDFKNRVQDPTISVSGACARGFRTSIKTMLPAIFRCLQEIQTQKSNSAPNRIFVTGHSLGGALATVFSSAVICGDKYGLFANPSINPLPAWPWKDLSLVTFGAPPCGDGVFATALNTMLPTIRRVLLVQKNMVGTTYDPVTDIKNAKIASFTWTKKSRRSESSKLGFRVVGYHAGTPVEIEIKGNQLFKGKQTQNTHLHEPANTRRALIHYLASLNVPLAGIPATNNAGQNDNEPWMEKKSFEDLIDHLRLNFGLSNGQITAIFKNLNLKINFGLYMDIFHDLLDDGTQKSILTEINNIKTYSQTITDNTPFSVLVQHWTNTETGLLKETKNDNIYKFIGLSLLMCGASEDANTYFSMIGNPTYTQKRPFA
jgi:hypothetical protein